MANNLFQMAMQSAPSGLNPTAGEAITIAWNPAPLVGDLDFGRGIQRVAAQLAGLGGLIPGEPPRPSIR
jgi:hypothetical protein